MAITYLNRQSQTYFLHVGVTSTGKPRYYFSGSGEGDLADQFPDGYEIREQHTGQVTVRRKRPILITDMELQIVERELQKVSPAPLGYVDRDGKILTVYVSEAGGNIEGAIRALFPSATQEAIQGLSYWRLRYEPVMRFVLVDAGSRTFHPQRYCYLGAIDDWIYIGAAGPISEVASQYLAHIGKESYYDLM